MNSRQAQLEAFDRLLTIMDELREKCPWDKKQTMASLRNLTTEEGFELGEAILNEDEEEVKRKWENLKLKEGKKSVLEGVPKGMPAMIKAFRMQEKAKGVGFEFENHGDVLAKIKEEIEEFEHEKDPELMEKEMGDV